MGLPLLNGFIGEFTILGGTFLEKDIAGHTGFFWTAWAVPGVVLAAAYLLWLYQRVFFGKVTNPKNEKLADLSPRELLTFVPLIILALWIGLFPKPFFQILEPPVKQLVEDVRGKDYLQQNGMTNASAQPAEKDFPKIEATADAKFADKGAK
jgi:NADH-quinone oxidoreductase subunit M